MTGTQPKNTAQNWWQMVIDWCESNHITDIRPAHHLSPIELTWPPYSNATERIIRTIHLHPYEISNQFVFNAYSGAYINPIYPPLRVRFSDMHGFRQSDLEMKLAELKQYADRLTEEDFVMWEEWIKR